MSNSNSPTSKKTSGKPRTEELAKRLRLNLRRRKNKNIKVVKGESTKNDNT